MLRSRLLLKKMDEFGMPWRTTWAIVMVVFITGMLTIRLESVPSLWWDEGWTLSVARNWVERGHYGRLRSGEPYTAGLAAAPAVVAPIVASFKLFGVGVWQGRLPGVIFTIGALGLAYYLAGELYNRRIALGTISVLLLMTVGPWQHPILVGRQVLGEMPAMFFLLAGYAFILLGLRKSIWLMLPAWIFWGLALRTKAQVLPFWFISMIIPIAATLLKRWLRQAGFLVLGTLGTWVSVNQIDKLQARILTGHVIPQEPLSGIYDITTSVVAAAPRLSAWLIVFTIGLPTLLGLLYGAWRAYKAFFMVSRLDRNLETLKLVLLSLAGSWLAWYLLLANFFVRYLFPAVFLGSVFAAALLYRLTSGFSPSVTVLNAGALVLKLKLNRNTVGAMTAILLVALTVPLSLAYVYQALVNNQGPAAVAVTRYIEDNFSTDGLIETYDSELLFLSDRRFHYPSDQVSIDLMRRAYIDPNMEIGYDPLDADPNYLIVGRTSREWGVYETVLEDGAFQLLKTIPPYEIYQRVGK